MIQLRYSTGNLASAIFGFKLNSTDGEQFSFKLDREVGGTRIFDFIKWLTKDGSSSHNEDGLFLYKKGMETMYQKMYISSFKSVSCYMNSKSIHYSRKHYTEEVRVFNDMFRGVYNNREDKLLLRFHNNIIDTRVDDYKATIDTNYSWIGTTDMYINLENEYLGINRYDISIKLYDVGIMLDRTVSKIYLSTDSMLLNKDRISQGLSRDYVSLSQKANDTDVAQRTNMLLDKEKLKANNKNFNVLLSIGNSNIFFHDSISLNRNHTSLEHNIYSTVLSRDNSKIDASNGSILLGVLESGTWEEHGKSFTINNKYINNDNIIVSIGDLSREVDNDNTNVNIGDLSKGVNNNNIGVNIGDKTKEVNKDNAIKEVIKMDSGLRKLNFDSLLSYGQSKINITDNKFLVDGNKYISYLNPLKSFDKKIHTATKLELESLLETTYIEAIFSNDIIFIYRDRLFAGKFNTEKLTKLNSKESLINRRSVSLSFDSKSSSLKEIYKTLELSNKHIYVDDTNGSVHSGSKSVSIYREIKELFKNKEDVDIISTNKWFDISGECVSIDDTYGWIGKGDSSVWYSELSKGLDSYGKTVGIFSSDWLSDASSELSIENYLIMGYNHSKTIDKDKITFLSFEKDEFDFIKSNEITLKQSGKDVVVTDNIFGHVDDFVPPIEILKKASDELLLPQKGFDYSTYKDDMFDLNLVVKRKYIKGYTEENQGGNIIINVPIENPVRYYAEIAKEYIEVDVKIMRKVLELLYRNWRDNIHRHAGMEPSKAINNILELTHKDLLEFYTSVTDVNRIKHAERSLKLFAWYCEMGMLSHSDKEVVYKRANGVFDFWRVLPQYGIDDSVAFRCIPEEEITEMSNFNYSPENKFILSSSPGINAYITIAAMPQTIDTALKFKGYIIGKGVIRVSVDGRVYTYNERVNIVDVPIPAEGSPINIMFFPSSEESYLDIAEFIIQDRYNDSYDLVYTGKVKNMNYTLQYVLDFMSITGDSIEEVQPVLKSTAQLAYALDRFKEYMETHHDNKFKGKRLTVRK